MFKELNIIHYNLYWYLFASINVQQYSMKEVLKYEFRDYGNHRNNITWNIHYNFNNNNASDDYLYFHNLVNRSNLLIFLDSNNKL